MDKFDQEYDDTSPDYGQEDTYEEAPEDTNELVSVRVNGKTLQVTAAVADEIHALSENFTRKISEQGNELGHLRRQVSQITTPAHQQQEQTYDPQFDEEFYKSPSQALNRVKQVFRQEIEQDLMSRVHLQNEQAKRWEQFFVAYPDLRGKEEIIQPIFNRLASQYAEVPPDMLANESRKRLEQITGKKTTLPQGKAMADSGGSPSSRPKSNRTNKTTPPEETVSDINKAFWGRMKQK